MNREEEIEELASKYADDYGYFNVDLDDVACGFIDGAKWADEHSANPWHSAKDGDLPKTNKVNGKDTSFIVKTKCGNLYIAYFAKWFDEEYRTFRYDFFDNSDCLLEVDYWMEMPGLPTELEKDEL